MPKDVVPKLEDFLVRHHFAVHHLGIVEIQQPVNFYLILDCVTSCLPGYGLCTGLQNSALNTLGLNGLNGLNGVAGLAGAGLPGSLLQSRLISPISSLSTGLPGTLSSSIALPATGLSGIGAGILPGALSSLPINGLPAGLIGGGITSPLNGISSVLPGGITSIPGSGLPTGLVSGGITSPITGIPGFQANSISIPRLF
jgi:hypothetical protein